MLHFESLETRRVLASIQVDHWYDEDDGNVSPGSVSLREAISIANASPGPDDIVFAPIFSTPRNPQSPHYPWQIAIQSQLPKITSSLSIAGPSNNTLEIVASDGYIGGAYDGYRIFEINDNSESIIDVLISNIRISGGAQLGNGGAIANVEALTLRSVGISRSFASGKGGLIWNEGSLSIESSTMEYGMARNGGGIFNAGELVVTNSTISGNEATSSGAGLFLASGSTNSLSHSTIGLSGSANAIENIRLAAGSTTTLSHTIVDGEIVGSGSLTGDFNLMESAIAILGSNNLVVDDVGLATLLDNGGPIRTHDLRPTSPAIDAGDPSISFSSDEFDQRGADFVRVQNGRIDIGAVESNQVTGELELLLDIQSSPESVGSNPHQLVAVGEKVFFSASTVENGSELWVSDGTPSGTTIVKDIFQGPRGSLPSNMVSFDGRLFFTADDGSHGIELWTSDGTLAGTHIVTEIYFGETGSWPTNLTVVGDTLFFMAYTYQYGTELWRTDGTSAGTMLVADIQPGIQNGPNGPITSVNGTLFFAANDGTNGLELWRSDGTAEGTAQVSDINSGGPFSNSFPSSLTNAGGTLFFKASDDVNGIGIWTSDGTSEGTVRIADSVPRSFTTQPQFVSFNGMTYFKGNDGSSGDELWVSDGTASGTFQFADLRPGSASSSPDYFTVLDEKLYFIATDENGDGRLWTTDGTPSGTVPVSSHSFIVSSRGGMISANDKLFYSANDGSSGHELWSSDGTEAGTVRVADLGVGVESSDPWYLTNVDGVLYFSANDGMVGRELWASDGTTNGTSLVADLAGGTGHSRPSSSVNIGGTTYFAADDGIHGIELWKTDGTAAGTNLVADIVSGAVGSGVDNLVNVNGELYFSADTNGLGKELWKSDGTTQGTALVLDINAGNGSSSPSNLTNVDGTLYFGASNETHSEELWKSDGTAAGTVLVADIVTGIGGSAPKNFVNVNGTLYFVANDQVHGNELWSSDGTEVGTALVVDLRPGSSGSDPGELTNVNGLVYFHANDGTHGVELWTSDGTVEETHLVADIRPGSQGSNPSQLLNLNGLLHFSASSLADGTELWRSNGTTAGTAMLDEFRYGTPNISFSSLTNVNGTLYFVANNFIDLNAIWKWNPLSPEFQRVIDPTGPVNLIRSIVEFNGGVLVVGQTAANGIEWFKLVEPPPPTIDKWDDIELISSTSSGGDRFGNSVAIDGDYAVVGAYLDDPNGLTNAGSAFIYHRTGETEWTQVAHLTGDSIPSSTQSQFGYSVAISGDTVAVGAQADRENGFRSGAVYVFHRNQDGADNWELVKKLVSSDTTTGDRFGSSVTISGDSLVVGARAADPVGKSSGAAYLFDRNEGGMDNWGEVQKLVASNAMAGDQFGHAVSIDGDLVAIGAFRHDGTATDTGAVYIYARDPGGTRHFSEIKVTEAADAAASDQFGYSVSVSGQTVAIGAPLDDEQGMNQRGSVYLFSQDAGGAGNWGQVTKILVDDANAGDRLGWSVSISGDRLVSGAIGSDSGGTNSGLAYSFENLGGVWAQSRILVNDQRSKADEFASAIAVDGDIALVGAWLDNRPVNNSGGAYLFDLRTPADLSDIALDSSSQELAPPLAMVFPLEEPFWIEKHALLTKYRVESDAELKERVSSLHQNRFTKAVDQIFAEDLLLDRSIVKDNIPLFATLNDDDAMHQLHLANALHLNCL
ncbi:hypothetical protein N9N28_11995 [Rubripirellula amarantea]|nr:hypothetical protein [Rubripirellula amarantea]